MLTRARPRLLVCLVATVALFVGACSDDDGGDEAADGGGSLLAEIRDRGTLRCGVNEGVPGFGLVDEAGDYAGLDVEFCKVVAAAVLGDAEAVEYTALDTETRFTALQAGDIDVLIRNTTFTASRDGGERSRFLATTFYDGQGMMVRADSGYESVAEMDGTTICVLSGTTTELNLASAAAVAGISYTPLTFTEPDQIQDAFTAGQCQGWTSDKSQLAGVRSTFPASQGGPEALTIFEDAFSKEPLGPVVLDGDDEWADAVNWAVIATVQAEEFGITSDNVDDQRSSDDLDVLRFLGQPIPDPENPDANPAPFDPGLGLEPDFAVDVITQVGNYGEIYERTVGPETPLGLERGLNAQWIDGGLLYAPPYR